MKSSMVVMALVMSLMQAAGSLPSSTTGPCRDTCTGDDPSGECPPFCDECVCCSVPAASVAVVPAEDTGPVNGRALHSVISHSPVQPAPREILHIPRPTLS